MMIHFQKILKQKFFWHVVPFKKSQSIITSRHRKKIKIAILIVISSFVSVFQMKNKNYTRVPNCALYDGHGANVATRGITVQVDNHFALKMVDDFK